MALTEQEKVLIRHHLGYPNVDEMMTFVLGVPAALETNFIIEGAMNRARESALPLIRNHIQILEKINAQKVDDLEVLVVTELGEITINPKEQAALDEQYLYWANSLANLLGVYLNPFDKRGQGGGINTPVMG
jgi:hypothetical protein